MADKDNEENLAKIVARTLDSFMDEYQLKKFGPNIIYRNLRELDECAELTVKYLSANKELQEKIKKMFSHYRFYTDSIDRYKLRDVAESGKLNDLFDARALMTAADNPQDYKAELSDSWLNVEYLKYLMMKNPAKVMEILRAEADTKENATLQNVIKAIKEDLPALVKLDYSDEKRLEKLQSVFDFDELMLEAKSRHTRGDSMRDPQSDYTLYQEKKSDIKRILQSPDLDFQLLDLCLAINKTATIALLRNDANIRKNTEKLFADCKTYMKQKELVKLFEANSIKTFGGFLQQSAKNMKKLSVEEVFAAMDMDNVPAKYDLQSLAEVLDLYYKQTYELSGRSPTSYLYYCDIGSPGYWNEHKLGLLNHVGKYRDVPVLEEFLEEKLGRAYAHYSYHEHAEFNSVEPEGINEFEKRLYEAMKKDIESPEARFYLQHGNKVLALKGYTDKFCKLMNELHDNYFEKYPKLVGSYLSVIKDLPSDSYCGYVDKLKAKLKKDILENFKNDPTSVKSQIYIEQAANIFSVQGGNVLNGKKYAEFLIEAIGILKGKHPEICDRLCKEALPYLGENVCAVYGAYHNKDLENAINGEFGKTLENIQEYMELRELPDLRHYQREILKELDKMIEQLNPVKIYEFAEITKLPVFEQILDLKLSIDYSENFKQKKNPDIDYGRLMDKVRSHIGYISLSQDSVWMIADGLLKDNNKIKRLDLRNCEIDCKDLLTAPNLEIINCYDAKINNLPEIMKAPNIKEIAANVNSGEEEAFVNALLTSKPDSLIITRPVGTHEQRMEILQKYPNFTFEGSIYNDEERKLNYRNEKIQNLATIKDAIEKGLLTEYLQVLPKDKAPTLGEFMQQVEVEGRQFDNCFEYIYKSTGKAEHYPEVLSRIAERCGLEEIKKEAELLNAIVKGELKSYIQAKQADRKEIFELLLQPMNSLGKSKSAIDYLEKITSDKEKFNDITASILIELGATKEDIKMLGDYNENGRLNEAIYQIARKQEINDSDAAAQAAFKAWQESKGIKR